MKLQTISKTALVLILAFCFLSCENSDQKPRQSINLAGQWQFALDVENVGIHENWYNKELNDVLHLPSTTDLQQKGFLNHDTTTMHLNRLYTYEGPAWYRKHITIPPDCQDKHIQLVMERTKPSMVWIDDTFVGESWLLQSPQCYDVSDYLTPGEHVITIRINNDLKLSPYGNVHIYSNDTQTNWNGIIGDFKLEISPNTLISDLQVFLDIKNHSIEIHMGIHNGLDFDNIDVELHVFRTLDGKKKALPTTKQSVRCDSLLYLQYDLGEEMALWDGYVQPLYQLTATIRNGDIEDLKSVTFGMRDFQAEGTQFTINGRTTFLRAWNLEVFKNGLIKSGMRDQDLDFHKASGALSALCYKAEMEAALRTAGMAGFQLLDLQDFPGQGTALVGILDAFMDSKNVISQEEWVHSCNDVVLLLEFPKYCWKNDEIFHAELQVANYSNKTRKDDIVWELVNQQNQILKTGTFSNVEIVNGRLESVGKIQISLNSILKAEKLNLRVRFVHSGYSNSYPIWCYPSAQEVVIPDEITVTHQLNTDVISLLKQGQKVLLFPTAESVKDKSVAGLFPPDFWNYGMFKRISENVNKPVSPGTLGLLMNPDHPLFNNFPTDFYTNWQWWSIVKASRALELNKTTPEYRPMVQVIDNLERNNKYGLIFEFAVGDGKLLVCMAPLSDMPDDPAARQLYVSIINYMESEEFAPGYSVEQNLLSDLL